MAITFDIVHANHTASNGGLTITDNVSSSWDASRSSRTVASGKVYWEIRIDAIDTNRYVIVGAASADISTYPGSGTTSWGYGGNTGNKFYGGSSAAYGSTYTAGDIIGIAVDISAGKIWFAKNNTWQASGNPAAGTGQAYSGLSGAIRPLVGLYTSGNKVSGRFRADAQSYSPPAGFSPLETVVPVVMILVQLYEDLSRFGVALTQPYGLRMGLDLVQPWADALVRRAGLAQPWESAGVLVAPMVARWQAMAEVRAELDQPWQVFGPVIIDLAQPWAILGAAAQGLLAQPWNLPGRDTLATTLTQPWSIGADASLLRYSVEVLAAGQPVRVSHVNIEGDLGQDVLSCEIHPETEGEYLLCALGAALQITVTSAEATSVFHFVVTAPRIDEQHGQTRYVVEAMSPAVLLGEPWATPIDGEHSGLASAIAAALAAPLTLDWQTVDWAIPAATFIASQQTPLALLKQVAAAVGAVVQSEPDGSLQVLPEYPLAVPAWPTATPDQSLTETLDLFTTASTPDIRSGHNKFLVGDQMTSADTLRLEEEALTATTKLVRGYQTPWTGAFSLRHTGGTWVQVEDLGIETRQETETVEIVAGSGRTRYPIVSRDAITWGQVNLGSVTVAEDGTLSAGVAGESLLTLTYTTRCRKWRVRDPNNEQLQLVADL